MKHSYTYDDFEIEEREEDSAQSVDFSTKIGEILLKLPVLSAPMDTLTNGEFAVALARVGAVGVIHKNFSIEEQCLEVEKFRKIFPKKQGVVGGAVGVSGIQFEGENPKNLMLLRATALLEAGADFLVVDTGHGHTKRVIESVHLLKKHFPTTPLIAGNVVTAAGTLALIDAGVDAVKVGIGGGSICTTRLVAGVGVPQLSAIKECAEVATKRGVPVIADGGIRSFEDVVKSFAAGASCLMVGSYLAATREAAGKTVVVGDKEYKYYRGMGTKKAMKLGSAERYSQDSKELVAEGIEALRELEGSVVDKLKNFEDQLRSFMQKNGCKNLAEFQEKVQLNLLEQPKNFAKTLQPNSLLLVPSFSSILPSKTNVEFSWEKLTLSAPLLIKTPSKVFIFSQEEEETLWYSQEEFETQALKTNSSPCSAKVVFVEFGQTNFPVFKQNIEKFKEENPQVMLVVCVRNYQDALRLVSCSLSSICVSDSSSESSLWLAQKLARLLESKNKTLVVRTALKTSGDLIKLLALGAGLIMLESLEEKSFEELLEFAEQMRRNWALGLAYCGAKNLEEFKRKAVLIAQSSAGVREASPHSVLPL